MRHSDLLHDVIRAIVVCLKHDSAEILASNSVFCVSENKNKRKGNLTFTYTHNTYPLMNLFEISFWAGLLNVVNEAQEQLKVGNWNQVKTQNDEWL